MAAVVLEARAAELGWSELLGVDSAGTGSWHAGEGIDRRAFAALSRRGYDGRAHRARGFERSWVGSRDLLIALDHSHLQHLERLRGQAETPEIRLLLSFDASVTAAGSDLDVPDPYYGDSRQFDECLAMIESGVDDLVSDLSGRLGVVAPPRR